jgi:microsomal dipeptidase-like Zn-dependent dipeptidase
MLVDLHAHFPMHVLPDDQGNAHKHVRGWARRRWQARIVNLISLAVNYQGPGDTASVTEELMRDGDVRVALSVLYAPFDEMDLDQSYGAPPRESYFSDILAQLQLVEQKVHDHGDKALIAHSPAELEEHLTDGRPVLVHCVEGGFQLGHTAEEVRRNVGVLADRGVAYVTVAHLFWRDVATSAPALPFLPDWLYDLVFRQPDIGLSELGRAAVTAMVAEGVLVDVTHMREHAIRDTLALLDELDPAKEVPLFATHMACRFGKAQYCLPDWAIKGIAARGGVLGCILCEHWTTDGLPYSAGSYEHSVQTVIKHIDHIRDVTGSLDNVGIGSDLDGYIKPALKGLEHMGHMRRFQDSLREYYGDEAEKIFSENALRVLRTAWRSERSARAG